MKRIFLIISIMVVCCLVIFFSTYRLSNLHIDKKNSFYSDFSIKEDKVYIKCILKVKNSTSHDQRFNINANFPDDVNLGLLKYENLKGYNKKLEDDIFDIKKNSSLTFEVVFIGEFAGNSNKHDRLLPQIIINPIQ